MKSQIRIQFAWQLASSSGKALARAFLISQFFLFGGFMQACVQLTSVDTKPASTDGKDKNKDPDTDPPPTEDQGEAGGGTTTTTQVAVTPGNPTYAGPLVITDANYSSKAYAGAYQGSGNGAVVMINTVKPVVFDGAYLKSSGGLIFATGDGVKANITVRNCFIYGTGSSNNNDAVIGRDESAFANLLFTNNRIEKTAGILVESTRGDRSTSQTVKILRNVFVNGWGDGDDSHPVQIANLQGAHGVEIAWNQFTHEAGKALVEDIISIYSSTGVSMTIPAGTNTSDGAALAAVLKPQKDNLIYIHDNFINGAYTYPISNSGDYTGGGIMLSDSVDYRVNPGGLPHGFVWADSNQVNNTSNYGVSIQSGHNCVATNNRVFSDGANVSDSSVGLVSWNSRHYSSFTSNYQAGGVLSWYNSKTTMNNSFCPDGACNYSSIARPTIDAEAKLWQAKLTAAAIMVGPTKLVTK